MELRHLRYFVAVAEDLSFTKAARKIRLAQPSLTRQVRNFGGRNHRGSAPVSFRLQKAAGNVRGERGGGATDEWGRARSSISDTWQTSITGCCRRIGSFRKLCPRVSLNLFDMSSAEQFEALEGRRIDLGFVGLRPARSGHDLLSECVSHDAMFVALPSLHPLAIEAKAKLADLAQQFFIGISARTHAGAREWLLEVCQGAGFSGNILQETDGEPTAIKFVAGGLGVALMPEQITGLPHEGVAFRPLSPPLLRESTIAWRADNPSTPLRDYIRIVKDLARSM